MTTSLYLAKTSLQAKGRLNLLVSAEAAKIDCETMGEAGGIGGAASKAPDESSKIFTMLGNPPQANRLMILHADLDFKGFQKTTRRS